MDRPRADERVVAAAAATIGVDWTDEEGDAIDPGTVTVGVAHVNGTVVKASGAATTVDAKRRTVTLSATDVPAPALLVATWTSTTLGVRRTLVEVAGGFWFSVAAARAIEPEIKDSGRYPAPTIQRVRLEVEDEAEQITDRSFVRRYRRAVLSGSGGSTLDLPDGDVVSLLDPSPIVSVTVDGVAFTGPELAGLTIVEGATAQVRRPNGAVFTSGVDNVVIEYRFGWDQPPHDLRRAAVRRLRYALNSHKSGIPDGVKTWTNEAGTFTFATGGDGLSTGYDNIDRVYARYSRRRARTEAGPGGMVDVMFPAARSFDVDPQRGSLFHGERR